MGWKLGRRKLFYVSGPRCIFINGSHPTAELWGSTIKDGTKQELDHSQVAGQETDSSKMGPTSGNSDRMDLTFPNWREAQL